MHSDQDVVDGATRTDESSAPVSDADERLEAFAEVTSGWFWETDADHRFTYFSRTVERATGVPPRWHYGKTRDELGAPESVAEDEWRAHLETLQRHEPFTNFVFQRVGPDGTKWMQTSGRPVFDPGGVFLGYRGIATDVTAQIAAERRVGRLTAAIENLSELFALWDPDDQLVVANRRFRELNRDVPETIRAGTAFVDHITAALRSGLYPEAVGREEEWLAERLFHHRHPSTPFAMERQDGRWILLTEHRLPDGSTATLSSDITAQKQAERVLADQHRVLETALKTIPDGVLVTDADLSLLAWNAQLFEVLALDRDEILGAENPGRMIHCELARRGDYGPGDVDELIAARRSIIRAGMTIHFEWELLDGRWIECRGNPVEGGGYVAVYRDISEPKSMIIKLERIASTDPLTGAMNRRAFLEAAEAEYQRARRYGHPTSVLLLDLDHFKSVNDRYGHALGDAALRHVVELCQRAIRAQDSLARFGGEEFLLLLPDTPGEFACELAERLRRRVADEPLVTADATLELSVSIGVAELGHEDASINALIGVADDALYEAKRRGRNQVCYRAAQQSAPQAATG